ncbi:MAG: cupin domain-containing protein [Saprospiraceae bacterium]
MQPRTKLSSFTTSIVLLLFSILFFSCQEAPVVEKPASTNAAIFPKGKLGPAENFTGNAYNYGLVSMDSTFTTLVGNVYFEPGARSNWHTHPGGQILIITDGIGYHQIEGQAIEIMKKGDVIKCPPNKRHWHGASPDSDLQQMYIVPNTEKGIIEWMEPVTDEQYNNI